MQKAGKKLLLVIGILISIVIIGWILIKVVKLDEIILKKLYPTPYSEYVYQYAQEYNVDPLFIFAIMKAESNFNPEVVSSSNAVGLMQLMEPTAKELIENMQLADNISTASLKDPKTNIMLGIKYYATLEKQYGGNKLLAITAYNAGIGNVEKWIEQGTIKKDGSDIENIPFKETNNYVRKIIQNYKMYMQLYQK